MNTIEKIRLSYSEDFKTACRISNYQHKELIQFFIDHVSFYAFIGGYTTTPFQLATEVCLECKDFWNVPLEKIADERMRDISLEYMGLLTVLSNSTHLVPEDEVAQSTALMQRWAKEALTVNIYPAEVITEEGEKFLLSLDFNLICSLHGLKSAMLIQFFTDNISLPRARALSAFEDSEEDPSMSLLLEMGYDDRIRNRILPHQEVYKAYGLKLLKLDRKLKYEHDVDKRLVAYTELYRNWYEALQI